jgi:hypothetical protein
MTNALPDSVAVQIKLRAAQTLLSHPFNPISANKNNTPLNFRVVALNITGVKQTPETAAATELFPKARAQEPYVRVITCPAARDLA